MREREGWSIAKEVSRLFLIAVILSVGIGVLAPLTVAPPVQASVLADKKDDKDRKEKEKKNKDDDRGEDFILNGQVLEIDTHKDPPEMIVGTVDGNAKVRVLKTDEIAINGVGVGDYVELTGEKVNELLFEATEISVGQRFSGPRPESLAGAGGDADTDEDVGHVHSDDDGDEDGDPE